MLAPNAVIHLSRRLAARSAEAALARTLSRYYTPCAPDKRCAWAEVLAAARRYAAAKDREEVTP